MPTTVILPDLLRPDVVLGIIVRNRLMYLSMSEMLGLAPTNVVSSDESGSSDASLLTANAVELPARSGFYDIYDKPQDGVPVVMPGAPASREALHPIGQNAYQIARFNPSIHLLYDKLKNQRSFGQNDGVLDSNGINYVNLQTKMLGLKTLNSLEIMTLGMMQDSLYLIPKASDPNAFDLSFTSTNNIGRINFQIPTGNKGTLDMTGGGAIIDAVWSLDNTKIVTHCNKISDAFVYLNGRPLSKIAIDSVGWSYVINNTEVRTAAGTASSPWSTYDVLPGNAPDGIRKPIKRAVLKALPEIEWTITDERIKVAGSSVKKIPTGRAFFSTDPQDVYQLGYYKEPIVEKQGQAAVMKSGFSTWWEEKTNPSGVEFFTLMNLLPMLNVPSAQAWGTIA